MVSILVQSVILLLASLAHAEVIAGTNFEARNWNYIDNFREGELTKTVDSSTNAITSTLTNGLTWVSGKPGRGNAINFDGANDIVVVPSASEGLFDFSVNSTFTIIVLFKNPSGGDNRIFASKVTWPADGWVFRTGPSGAKLGVYYRMGNGNHYYGCAGITNAMFINGNWHTAALVFRGKIDAVSGTEFWFDGVKYATTDETGTGGGTMQNNANLVIGNTEGIIFTNYVDEIGAVMVSRDGYAPDATGMMSLHRRLMGQVGQVP